MTNKTVVIKIGASSLLNIIKGGNRNVGFENDVKFNGKSSDPDQTDE
jgi:hypothetical protein